jgi:hypothetical protein
MDISKFTKATGTYLKPLEVKANPKAEFVIISEGVVVENDFKGKKSERVHVEGEFNKESRILDMSKTNARLVEKALGSDTKKWIGHSLVLETYRTKTSDGTLTDAINIAQVK